MYPVAAAVKNTDVALWVKRLANQPWIPAIAPGGGRDDPPSLVLRPCEVVLPTSTSASPGVGGASAYMPTAYLSAELLQTISELHPKLTSLFAFASVKPTPPVDRLEMIAKLIIQTNTANGTVEPLCGTQVCSMELFNELVGIWVCLCSALDEQRLSPSELLKIKTIVHQKGYHSSQQAGTLCLIPYLKTNTTASLISISHCVHTSAASDKEGKEVSPSVKRSAGCALSHIGFILDFNLYLPSSSSLRSQAAVPPESKNIFTVAEVEAGGCVWVLASSASALSRMTVPAELLSSHLCVRYLKYISEKANSISSSSSSGSSSSRSRSSNKTTRGSCNTELNIMQKRSFSLALWLVVKTILISNGASSSSLSLSSSDGLTTNLSDEVLVKANSVLRKTIPSLCIYCKAFFPQPTTKGVWISAWPEKTSAVIPVLFDDKQGMEGAGSATTSCGVPVSHLLSLIPNHGCRPIGVLNYCDGTRGDEDCSLDADLKWLSVSDSLILKVLRIPRLSDKLCFSVEVKSTGIGESMAEASERFEVVMLLLKALDSSFVIDADGDDDDNNSIVHSPVLIKHKALAVSVSYPTCDGGRKTSLLPFFALRSMTSSSSNGSITSSSSNGSNGSSSSSSSSSSAGNVAVLCAGDADDYVTELEEISIALLNITPPSSQFSVFRKALSLLKHIENGAGFLKFYGRYFQSADSLVSNTSTEGVNDDIRVSSKIFQDQKKLHLLIEGLQARQLEVETLRKQEQEKHNQINKRKHQLEAVSITANSISTSNDEQNKHTAESFLSSIRNNSLASNTSNAAAASAKGMETGTGPLALSSMSARGVSNLPAWMTQGGDIDADISRKINTIEQI